jgi:hypothetical protein
VSRKDNWETHPSFGLISIARCQGAARLFESPFTHQNFITLSISRASRQRTDLHENHVMPDEEIVEVAMSEVQFATLISSLNMGFGRPCTIRHLDGKLVAEPKPDETKQTFEREGREHFEGLLAMAKELEKLTAMKASEMKAPQRERMQFLSLKLSQGLSCNLEFFHKQVQRTMDKVVSVAKAEIEAHMVNVTQRAGLAALAAKQAPLLLEMGDGEKQKE